MNTLKNLASEHQEKWFSWREALHRIPELSDQEFKTTEYIVERLKELGAEDISRPLPTGVTALIRGAESGPTVLLRADIDALPITEETGAPFASLHEGVMHACGHDMHMTTVLAAADLLIQHKEQLKGNVRLVFQPAEEGEGGADRLIQKGVMEEPKVDACLAMHVWPTLPMGTVYTRDGALMASPDEFYVHIIGKGGHAALPHLCIDPIKLGAKIALAFEKVSKEFPAVITVASFHAGTCNNVIPDDAMLTGTVRAFDREMRKAIHKALEKASTEICEELGAKCEFRYEYRYPPLINDKEVTEGFRRSALKQLSPDLLCTLEKPEMTGEDFSYFAEKAPATMFLTGCRDEKGTPLHHPKFLPPKELITTGALLMAQYVLDFLSSPKAPQES